MTQEFKDQNGIEVDGQLVCRHFICGRCVKVGYVCFLEMQMVFRFVDSKVLVCRIDQTLVQSQQCFLVHFLMYV